MYGQQKRNIIHKSSTAYEQDHSDQRDELAPFHLDRPLSKPTHWTFVVAPDPPHRTPIAGPIPGVQINARIAEDPQGQARILIRLPDNWNGRLVVAGAPGTRSKFNGDFAWSDYVVQKGYAYVAQNKGTLNLRATTAADPTACRLNPALGKDTFVHFYDDDPGMPFTRWAPFMAEAARLGRAAVQIHYGRDAQYTYAVGTSNGGYQVRRAVETYPELFDGGVDWEGTFVDADMPNLLSTLRRQS